MIIPETPIVDYTLMVDIAVAYRNKTLEEALKEVPEDKRAEVKRIYEEWHKAR